MKPVFVIVFLLVLSALAGKLEAQMVESAKPVPSGITGSDLKELEEQKSGLDREFEEISSSTQEYNSLCTGGIQNSMGCQGRYLALTGRMATYQASLVRYHAAIREAVKNK